MTSISKSHRLVYLLEALKDLGVAQPSDLAAKLALRLNESINDENFRRTIYRDLNDLADQGRILARYTLPTGEEIVDYIPEQHRNVRLLYTHPDHVAQSFTVPGGKLIEKLGGKLIPSKLRSIDWRALNASEVKFKNAISFVFSTPSKEYLVLQVPRDQVPVRLIVSRVPGDNINFKNVMDEVTQKFGDRASVLFSWDKSVSRFGGPTKLGHCVVSINKDFEIEVSDLNSSSGSFWHPLDNDHIQTILSSSETLGNGSTLPMTLDPLSLAFRMRKIDGTALCSQANVIQLGNFRFAILG